MIQVPICLIVALCWILLSIICGIKQMQASKIHDDDDDFLLVTAIMLSPFWFIGAIIRQVFIEKWK